MEKRNWKIYYSSYQGPEKRAVELVYRELGKYVLRDNGIYSFHSLDCVREGFPTDCNAIILGTYNENPVFRKYLEHFEKIFNYVFEHFPDDGHPEWFGHLHRDGTPISYIKGSDWKGPFHNVRAFMLLSQILEKIENGEELQFNRWEKK